MMFSQQSVQITIIWNVTPCSMLESYQHVGGTCCLHLQVLAWQNDGMYCEDGGSRFSSIVVTLDSAA